MTINDEILIVANQLANAGHKPTVALIKAKLNNKAPLPVIISTLKIWQHDPNFIAMPEISEEKYDMTNSIKETVDNDNFRQKLNGELSEMRQEIIELKQLIQVLIKQQKN